MPAAVDQQSLPGPGSHRPAFLLRCPQSAQGIQELLDVAKQDIPFDFWKATPLVLKATAGLRLLPGVKAQKLLQKVSPTPGEALLAAEGEPYPW